MNIEFNRTESRKITRAEFLGILHEHPRKRNFSYINLSGEDLSNLNLSNIIFRNANLSGTIIKNSFLTGADLSGADLSNAIFVSSPIRSANLSNSNLDGALFYNTDLEPALIDMPTMDRYFPSICPSEGEFIGWKKAVVVENLANIHQVVVKLLIPKDAKRGSAFGRKCRCDKATVLSIESLDGFYTDFAFSTYDFTFKYEIGKEVSVDNFDEDRRHECAPGIHFFMTREEAVAYLVSYSI